MLAGSVFFLRNDRPRRPEAQGRVAPAPAAPQARPKFFEFWRADIFKKVTCRTSQKKRLIFYSPSFLKLLSMEEVRDAELDTNVHTALGTNVFGPWAKAEHVEHEEVEEFPGHQPEEWSGASSPEGLDESSGGDVEFVYTEAEKDAMARLRASGIKRPRSPPLPPSVPDLAEVFDQHDTTPATRVSVCRAYASYVASTLPKKPKAPKKKASKQRTLHFE